MEREEALEKLGLSSAAGEAEIKAAWAARCADLEERIGRAPTDDLRSKYESQLAELRMAAQCLGLTPEQPAPSLHQKRGAHSTPLSKTMERDLPLHERRPTLGGPGQPGADSSGILHAGQVLVGRYEIRELIGTGGVGAVYRAFDGIRGDEVALKVMLPSLVRSEEASTGFLTEAKTCLSLSHPNIVRVYDVNQEEDFFFLTMELLKGKHCASQSTTMRRVRNYSPYPKS